MLWARGTDEIRIKPNEQAIAFSNMHQKQNIMLRRMYAVYSERKAVASIHLDSKDERMFSLW